MTWQILPDASTRTNAITSDTVQAIDSVPVTDLATLAERKSMAAEQGFGLVFIMFNCGSEPMSDVKNRRAIMSALDYDQICAVGMSVLATPATCFVQKEHPAYKQASVDYTQDLEAAKGLLAETGLTEVRLLASDHDFFASARPMIKESLEAAGLRRRRGPDAALVVRRRHLGRFPHALEGLRVLHPGAGSPRRGRRGLRRRAVGSLAPDLRSHLRGGAAVPDLPQEDADGVQRRDL